MIRKIGIALAGTVVLALAGFAAVPMTVELAAAAEDPSPGTLSGWLESSEGRLAFHGRMGVDTVLAGPPFAARFLGPEGQRVHVQGRVRKSGVTIATLTASGHDVHFEAGRMTARVRATTTYRTAKSSE
jgi:hypothetical protein